jgi:hypothetical protein
MKAKVSAIIFALVVGSGTLSVANAAPVNSTLPIISGDTGIGSTLSVYTGTWNSTQLNFNIQWFACTTSLAASCLILPGRTGSSYLLTSNDLGKFLRASITALDTTGGSTVFTAIVGPVVQSPQATTLPTISGVATPGSVLQATRGVWTGAGTTGDQYQWLKCPSISAVNCTVLVTSGSNTYTVQNSDTASHIAVNVIVKDLSGRISGSARSSATAAVLGSPTNTTAPKFTSDIFVGGLATTDNGVWNISGRTNYIYQWQRCTSQTITSCINIIGATNSSYLVPSSDLNTFLRVSITALNEVGGATIYSGFSPQVAATAPPKNTSAPMIAGTLFEGATLNLISKGQWSWVNEAQLLVQWQSCLTATNCSDLVGATGNIYTLTAINIGKSIRVKITAPYSQRNIEAFSNLTSAIRKAHTNLFAPTLLSYADVGDTIDIFKGSWEGMPFTKLIYNWQRCKTVSTCVNIPGATNSSYKVTSSDIGHFLRVSETPSLTTPPVFSDFSNMVASNVVVAQKRTISCVKGKASKKVTAVNPKCPSGFKKKK